MTTKRTAILLAALLPLALSGTALAKAPAASPISYATATQEFRATVRSSPALRLSHIKRVASLSAAAAAGAGLGGLAPIGIGVSTLTMPPVGMGAAFLAAGVAITGGLSTAFIKDAIKDARLATARDAVKQGLITRAKLQSWQKALLFGRIPVSPHNKPQPQPCPHPHTTTTTTTTT